MAQKVEDPQVEIERLKAANALLTEQLQAAREGKDETGTYGWTNLPQDDADRLRCKKEGKRWISPEDRNRDMNAWVARGGMDVQSPEGQVVVRDASTGAVLEAPTGAPKPAPGKPATSGETVESADERTVI